MNRHSTSHSGLLVTGNGDDLDVELELIGGRTLRLSSAGEEIGAWPVDECAIEPDVSRGGAFRLLVDGDAAVFTPSDPIGFRALAERLGTGEGAVAAAEDDQPVDTAPSAPPSAADDPVAFLFGSSPPPTPAVEIGPDPDFDPLLGHVPSTESREEPDPLGAEPAEGSSGEAVELVDDRVVDDPLVDEAVVDEPAVDEAVVDEWLFDDVAYDEGDVVYDMEAEDSAMVLEVIPDEPMTEEAVADDASDEPEGTQPDPLVESSPAPLVESPDPILEMAADPADDARSRLSRGSALDRLSEAIGTLKTDDDGEYVLGPHTVAEDVIESQRSLRDKRLKEVARGKQLKMAAIVVSVVGVVSLLVLLTPRAFDFIRNYEGGAELPPTIPVTEVVVTTTGPTVTAPEPATTTPTETVPDVGPGGGVGGTIFERPAPEFVAVWNAVGDPVSAVLRFEANPLLGPFEQEFTNYLRFVGEVEPDGTIAAFSVVVDPTGPSEHDRLGMQALGVAIAAVEPTRSPAGRASLLLDLGLNVRQPILEGIDGTVTSNGILYRLVYDPESILLTLTVAPAG